MRTRLSEERRATAFANLRRCAAFRDIARNFAERNIPLMALKGLHLAELVYRDISLRPMDDVDILVPRAELGQAGRRQAAWPGHLCAPATGESSRVR